MIIKKKRVPKVLKAWWSEKYAKMGEKVNLNALTLDAISYELNFKIYEFRRKNKIISEINIPVSNSNVSTKWKVLYKPALDEYGNSEFRFKAAVGKSSKTSKTLYVPAEIEIALTFDDGPAPKENPRTEWILDVLKDNKIQATFFVEHSNIQDNYRQKLLMRMKKAGHEIGIHGVDPIKHHLRHQDTSDFKNKLKTMRELIKQIIGGYPSFIRPPYGWGGWEKGKIWNKTQLRKFYQGFNLTRVDGWKAEIGKPDFWRNVDKIIENTSMGNRQKLIILAHDLREYDTSNLKNILKEIQEKADKVKVKVIFTGLKDILKK